MNFAEELMDHAKNHWSKNLNEAEMKVLDEWVIFYQKRYPIVARLAEDIKKIK